MTDTPTCYICGGTDALQLHHIVPQATGGEEGPTVWLCPNCHQLAHHQALNILSKQPNRQLFPERYAERAARVVRYIVLAIRRERENPDFSNPYMLNVKTTKGAVALLHILKSDAGFSNMNDYVNALLQAAIRSRFGPMRTNQKQAKTAVKSKT